MNQATKRLNGLIGREGLKSTTPILAMLIPRIRIGWAMYFAACNITYYLADALMYN